MTLREYIRAEFESGLQEIVVGMRPVSNMHPPSLRDPVRVKIPMSQDGWERGASREARSQAINDLATILERSRRQIGKPEMARTTAVPPMLPPR